MALTAGNIAFVGFNADGNDNIAFVALVDINPTEVIIFEDNEWNGSTWTDTNENAFSWAATSLVRAGTIVTIDNIGVGTISASTGTVVLPVSGRGTGRGIAGSNEVVYAYQGNAGSPTFIAAIANSGFTTATGLLTNTGLTAGTNAIDLSPKDDGADVAAFDSARNNQASFAAYLPIINNSNNWITQDAAGDQNADSIAPDVPFSNTAFSVTGGSTFTSIDLSTYVRVGLFNLPVSTGGANLLATEVSAVTYNKDTDTLFVVGDGGTAIVQVSKTGVLIDSMSLTAGLFADPEGLTYVGNGQFVIADERVRQASLFTYTKDTTLTASSVKTVKLGTTIGNIGIEGITFDPLTNGFIAVKEENPLGVFQTTIDFTALTASNGSATTVNSTDLFTPASAGLLDFADVFAFSTLSPTSQRLLLLSQASGKIVNIDRAGNISSSLTIISEPGNILSVPDQQFEGLTVDKDGFLYVTSENNTTPKLSVYAPSTVPNQAPTAVVLSNKVNAIAENVSTFAATKVADISITDDALGTNTLSLTGTDASLFEITGKALFVKAGTALDFETKPSFSVNVNVDDSTVGNTPDATSAFSLLITDVVDETPLPTSGSIFITEVAPWSSGNSPVAADWFELTNTGSTAVNIAGWRFDDDSNAFDSAAALSGLTTINAGESVIFVDGATVNATFSPNWFGANPPANLKIGNYSGIGLGLSTSGDSVNIFNSTGVSQARVAFGTSPSTAPFATFDNAALANNATIATLSAVGVKGAFVAANSSTEIGSPGAIGAPVIVPTKINAVQGSAATQITVNNRTDGSPLNTQSVTIEGVVVADFQSSTQLSGFFIQEEDSDRDNNSATSEGIFVFTGTTPILDVQEGQVVRVTGNVSELFGMTQVSATAAGSLQIVNAGNNLNLVTPATIDLPPTGNINAFYEQYEGMRVKFADKLFVSEYFEQARYGQIVLNADGRPFQYSHTDNTPTVAENTAYLDNLTRNRIILDDDNNRQNAPLPDGKFLYPQPNGFGTGTQGVNYFRGGDSVSNLTGVLHWSFAGQSGTDAWRVRPTMANPITFAVENPRSTSAPNVGGNVKVASFNVLNYFNTIDTVGGNGSPRGADSADEFDRQNAKLIDALTKINADVFGLIEIENNGDATNPAVKELVTRLNAKVGSEVYDYIRTGKVGTDQITNAFIYKKAVLEPKGAAAILTDKQFVNPNNFTQDRNRPAIAQNFRVIDANNPDFGESFNVVVNHLKSKGGSDAVGADVDQNDGQGQFNDTRNKAANYLVNTWIPSDPTGQGDADYLVIGDLNAYKGEAPITTLKNAGYTDLVEKFGGNNAYGYLFNGQLGYLDHALANNTLNPQVTGVAEWHINADEAPVFDYNNSIDDGAGESSFEAKPTGNNLYEPNAFRTSDHDPVLIGLNLGSSTPQLTPKLTNIGNTNAFDVFSITGGGVKTQIKLTIASLSSNLVNELGIFTVDDAAGTINGLAPNAAGYAQAALDRGKAIFSTIANAPTGFSATGISRLLELNTNDKVRFYLVKNSTTDSVQKKLTPLSDVLFASTNSLRVTSGSADKFTLSWQDGSDNSANFNNLVVNIEASNEDLPLGVGLQGNTEAELIDLRTATKSTTAEFTVNREAAFNNFVGFYRVADAQGGIDTNNDGKADILVGQSGYIQSAISNRVAGIDLTVSNQGTASYTGLFQPGSIFAPFIIVNGRPEELLDSNASNDPAVYFPFLGANSDKVDHIRLLGNNIFGFEDLPSGGDRDFNDVIVRVKLT